MRHGDYAWAAIAAGVLAYEAAAPKGELLSEACHRYRERHPILTNTVVCYLALHLLRAFPPKVDPLHQFAVKVKR